MLGLVKSNGQTCMAYSLKNFCSYSSIGTDTRCCSNGAGFLFDITFCWWGNNHQRIYTKEMIVVLSQHPYHFFCDYLFNRL